MRALHQASKRALSGVNRIFIELRPERFRDHARMMMQDHEVEIAPDQFAKPRLGTQAAALPRGARQRTDGEGAEAQMHRQVGGGL